MDKIVIVADAQVPFHDQRTIDGIFHYIQDTHPTQAVNLGDWLDFPYFSTKFISRQTPIDEIQRDINIARGHLEFLVENTDDEVIMIEGNHEYRLEKLILERAPALEGFLEPDEGALTMAKILDVPGVKYVGPYGEAYIHKSFVFKHGDRASKYSAALELYDEHSSGMSGHVHKFQVYMHTDRSGAHGWYSIGCLCHIKGSKMPPGYRNGRDRSRNWQQGFAMAYFEDGLFNVYPIVCTNSKFISPEGILYGPNGIITHWV